MSTWLPETEMDSAEYDDSESVELYDSAGEDHDQESPSAAERKRARQRRVALAGRRQAQAQARARSAARSRTATTPARTTAQQTVTAIKNLDLETKVQEDAFRSAISAQGKRVSRSEYVAVAGAAVNQIIESFDAPDNPYAKAALRFAPLLLLSPQPKGTGFGAFAKDPRVIGAAAVAGITLVGENRDRFTRANQISVQATDKLAAGEEDLFLADVVDVRGVALATPVTWKSSDPGIAEIDPASGKITAGNKTGIVVITASADGIVRRIRLKVTSAAGAPAPAAGDGAPAVAARRAGGGGTRKR